MGGRHDVVVVGGGHNGLVAAAYLARAGRSVLVLERLERTGGAAVSDAVFAGVDVRLSTYAYLVSLLPDQIVADLGLDIGLVDRAVSSYTPTRRGGRHSGLLVERPLGEASAASFQELTGSHRALDGWRRFYRRMQQLAEDLAPTMLEPLLTPDQLRLRLRHPDVFEQLRALPLAEVVGQSISDDVAAGVALTDGLIGTFADVHADDGLANRCFLYHLIGNGCGEWRVPIGGMGAVSAAMASAAQRFGATIVTGATVTAVDADESGAEVAWRDTSGCEHRVGAASIVSAVAPQVLDRLRGGTPAARPVGAQVKVNMVLSRLPRLRSGIDPAVAFSGTLHVDESASQLDAAFATATAGRLPDPLPFEVYCHTLADDTILGPRAVRDGLHTLTLFALHTPTSLFEADNEAARERAVRLALAGMDRIFAEPLEECLALDANGAPCLHAVTPLDIEEQLAMPGGNIFHGDLSWPVAAEESAVGTWGVETDVPTLVSAASGGARRGGAVSGIGGHNAAMALTTRALAVGSTAADL